ncbi:hypothetical protein L3Q82_004948 [Scortum barcoo]|uniref:Uncharacterized protein n=1 Tax=Scortum barcoo TaxID=214431 RepID=A0ACB8VFM8_9TELE|nr:hypothetical protein L3Q82_004948 [Scortum barcoo]
MELQASVTSQINHLAGQLHQVLAHLETAPSGTPSAESPAAVADMNSAASTSLRLAAPEKFSGNIDLPQDLEAIKVTAIRVDNRAGEGAASDSKPFPQPPGVLYMASTLDAFIFHVTRFSKDSTTTMSIGRKPMQLGRTNISPETETEQRWLREGCSFHC